MSASRSLFVTKSSRTLMWHLCTLGVRLLISRHCFNATKPEQPIIKTDFACDRKKGDWWMRVGERLRLQRFDCVRRE